MLARFVKRERERERERALRLPARVWSHDGASGVAPPDRRPPRRGGRPSSQTLSAAGRPAGLACLAGARRGLVRPARALAAAALLALFGALALPAMAQAQSAGVLVSNLGQADDDTTNLDNTGYHGQAFSVGADGGNYTLTSIEISIEDNGIAAADIGSLSVSVWSTDSSGQPSSSLHSLTNPSSIAADATATFNAQAGATLEAGKTYAVVVYYDKTLTSDWPGWVRTGTGDDDSPATGWEIVDSSLFRVATSTNWRSVPGEAHEIRVNGTAVGGGTPSTDATLSALTVTAGGSDLVTFASGTTDYTPMVANDVEEVTVTAMTTDSGAMFEYLDGSDMTLTDADTGVDGHQVTLAVGDTVIKVKVTAEDGTTKTYKVTVTRAAAMTGGICDRTQQVQDAILAELADVDDCAVVTVANLAGLTSLQVASQSIDSLKSGDFAGLTSVTLLNLASNSFTTLPADVFSGLTALTTLVLAGGELTLLPAGVFSDLTNLTGMNLSNNALESLPGAVFSDLTALSALRLHDNSLDSLPADVFSGLTALSELHLNNNSLDSLPADVFSGLTALSELHLDNNALESLPGAVFSDLTALSELQLDDNALESLPDGVFSGLTALSNLTLEGNSTNPMELTVTVEKVGTNQVRAKVLAGAPFAVDMPVTPVNGTLEGSVTALGVAAGAVEGSPVTMTRTAGTTAAATVDVDLTTHPTLPTGHSGYIFKKATANLPATILPAADASTDATLSDLVVNDGNMDLTLTPTFASSTIAYMASVGTAVTEVTVTPTKNVSGATIEYLDANNMTLTDADTGVTGQQVAVAVGDTIIGVKVTAEDGNATQTYTVTVNRAAATPPTCTLNTGDLWCGVVAVGQIELSDRGVVEYGFKGTTIGDLLDNDGDKTFAIGANSYTIDRVTVGAPGAGAGYFTFSLTSIDLTATDKENLVLHVGSASFAFSNRTPTSTHDYSWSSTLDWSSESTVTLRLREAPAGPDATLSALVVKDGNRDLSLRPGFAPGTTSYRVWVVNDVAEVTVMATPNDAERDDRISGRGRQRRSPTSTPRIPSSR